MKKLFNKLNPWNWGLLTQRLYGASVFLLSVGLVVMVVMLGDQGVKAHRTAVYRLLGFGFLVVFTFLWLMAAGEEGYKRGFLIAVGYSVSMLALMTILSALAMRLLP